MLAAYRSAFIAILATILTFYFSSDPGDPVGEHVRKTFDDAVDRFKRVAKLVIPHFHGLLAAACYFQPTNIPSVDNSGCTRAVLGPTIQGRDMIGRARTGTGKTLAFDFPIMDKITRHNAKNGHACFLL